YFLFHHRHHPYRSCCDARDPTSVSLARSGALRSLVELDRWTARRADRSFRRSPYAKTRCRGLYRRRRRWPTRLLNSNGPLRGHEPAASTAHHQPVPWSRAGLRRCPPRHPPGVSPPPFVWGLSTFDAQWKELVRSLQTDPL